MYKRITYLIMIIYLFTLFGTLFEEQVSAKTLQDKFIEISSAQDRIIALKSDGTLWEWYYPKDSNFNNDTVNFVQVEGLKNIKYFASNNMFCLAIKNDGTVWGWGKNESGQLGDGTYIGKDKPVKVKNINNVKEISIKQSHCIALKNDGSVWVWGDAGYGTSSANGSINLPVKVKELSSIKSVSASDYHFTALKKDGSVWSWGYMSEAALGYSPISLIPKKVPGLNDIIALSANSQHTIALKKNGIVYVWGDDFFILKKLGWNGSNNVGKYEVNGLNNVSKVYAGEINNFVLKKDGTLWAWGSNEHGLLGIGDLENKGIPIKVNIDKVIQISTDYLHTVFLKSDGTIWLCGIKNSSGNYCVQKPITIEKFYGVKSIASSSLISAALKDDGSVWIWGYNRFIKLEKDPKEYNLKPKQIKGLKDIISIGVGDSFISALKNDGTVWALGGNTMGELGDSTKSDQSVPIRVPVLENIQEISSGYNYTLALKNDGTVWGFGNDELYKLEKPILKNLSAPQMINGMKDVKKIDAGDHYSLAIGKDGSLWCWRYLGFGLNAGGTVEKQEPQKILGIDGVIDIKNGAVLKNDGTVWVIDNNFKPKMMSNLSGVKSIYKKDGYYSIYTVDKNNALWFVDITSLYTNHTSDLDLQAKKSEIQLNINTIKNICNSTALQSSGSVLAWGNNEYGQVGNGDCSFIDTPFKLK